jgi:hypothetical protein
LQRFLNLRQRAFATFPQIPDNQPQADDPARNGNECGSRFADHASSDLTSDALGNFGSQFLSNAP